MHLKSTLKVTYGAKPRAITRLKELGLVELIEYKTPKARLQSNGYWVLDPLFYQKWLKRKAEIATDLQEKGLTYVKDAYPLKILRFYNLDKL